MGTFPTRYIFERIKAVVEAQIDARRHEDSRCHGREPFDAIRFLKDVEISWTKLQFQEGLP